LQMATDADKAAGQKEADKQVAQAIKHYGSQDVLETQLKAVNKTFDDWRTEMAKQATTMAVLIRVLNAAPTDADAKKYYDDNPKASEMPEQVHVRHILLMTMDEKTQAALPEIRSRPSGNRLTTFSSASAPARTSPRSPRNIPRIPVRRPTAANCLRLRAPASIRSTPWSRSLRRRHSR